MKRSKRKLKIRIEQWLETAKNFFVNRAFAGRIPTTELVNRVFNFCELYSGRTLFPYQEQFSKRVIRSILTNDGAEITALFSRQSGKSETIAVTVGGMMIILPTLANMPMFADDPRLEMFKDGLWVGIFAPSQRQAQITYGRMKARLQCKTARAVLEDDDFRLQFSTSNGQTVALTNGSFATAISASDGSNIEGESFKVIICEECFVRGTPILTEKGYVNIEDVKVGDKVYSFNHGTNKVELKTVQRSFSQPLYGRKIVTIKTESGREITCTDNHKIFISEIGYVRADSLQINDLMLSYKHTTQESEVMLNESNDIGNNVRGREYCVPRQEVFKKSEICGKSISSTERVCVEEVREGISPMSSRAEDSSEFRKGESTLSIYNKVFTRIKNVLRLVLQGREKGFDERHPKLNDRRSFSLLVSRRWKHERYDVHTHSMLHDGRESASCNLVDRELWYNTNSKDRQKNKQAFSLLQGEREEQVSAVDTSLCDTLYDVQDTYNRRGSSLCSVRKNDDSLQTEKDPYMLKGMSKDSQHGVYEELLQEEKIVSIEIKEVAEIEVFDLTVEDNHNFFANGLLVHNCQDISNFKIQKAIHPMGAAYNASIIKIGTATTHKGDFYDAIQRNKKDAEIKSTHIKNHFEYDYTIAAKYNPKYARYVEGEKKKLGENSDAFRMSYKLEWIIERGMFIDIATFERNNTEPLLERTLSDMQSTHVAGIDIGGVNDDTVVTVCEVDWNMPVIMESRTDEETGEDINYLAYNAYVVDWLRISNEPDYEEQYPIIMDYLSHFKIARVVCDATREAAVAHRLRANLNCEVIPYVFSSKSKSDLYKHLEKEIVTGRARICAGEETQKTVEYQMFLEQMADLQKGYSGAYLVVSHPDERGAHDDFPDSFALAVWGCSFAGEVNYTETKGNPFVKKTLNELKRSKRRNSLTGRRR